MNINESANLPNIVKPDLILGTISVVSVIITRNDHRFVFRKLSHALTCAHYRFLPLTPFLFLDINDPG